MKRIVLALFVSTIAFSAWARPATGTGAKAARTHVSSYTKKNGTYVAGHERSTADSTKNNNWSTKGNDNPITGKKGTK